MFDDGNGPALHAAGSFANASGVPAANIARWNGTSWSALGNSAPFCTPDTFNYTNGVEILWSL